MIIDLKLGLFCILFFSISILSYLFFYFKNPEKRSCKYWIIPIFIIYILSLAKITLFPIYVFDHDMIKEMLKGVENYVIFYQIKPFHSICNYFTNSSCIQLIGNLLLLSPLVIFVEIFTKGKISKIKEFIICSSVSLLIEILQLTINYITGYPGRVADIDDFILNSSGVILTILLVKLLRTWKFSCNILKILLYKK